MNIDQEDKLTEEQEKSFLKQFNIFAAKGSGLIRCCDIATVLRMCGQVPTDGWINEKLKAFDPNQKGFIDRKAFLEIARLSTLDDHPDDELLEAFRRFDKGHTGSIKCSELRSILTSLGDVLTKKEVDEFIREADPLEKGTIRYEAFARDLIYGP